MWGSRSKCCRAQPAAAACCAVRWHILRRARKGKDSEVTKAWAPKIPQKLVNEEWVSRPCHTKKLADCEENPERLLKNKDNSQNSKFESKTKEAEIQLRLRVHC